MAEPPPGTPEPDPFWWRDEPPTRPLPVAGGIQISRTRGRSARTWWSRRFLGVLEELGVGGRLSRGRSYARAGQIVSLDVDAGGAVARVQGSRPTPYRVRIGIPAFGKSEWAAATAALAAEAAHAAALLAGVLPHEIEDVFGSVGLSLFPASGRDIVMDCTCPDHAVPCKHLAAVFYVLAERFDDDPFQILALRGRDRAALLADLRARRAETAEGGAGPGATPTADGRPRPLAELLDAFFAAGPDPSARLTGPRTPPDALLDQVPEFPVEVRGERVTELLRPAYHALDGRT
ncbi:MAG TPA: SWIM zinc finger family protein [Pseudonocardia sp.]|nr:SWIM zinc finger family protein [Pseudonocardia sp.]